LKLETSFVKKLKIIISHLADFIIICIIMCIYIRRLDGFYNVYIFLFHEVGDSSTVILYNILLFPGSRVVHPVIDIKHIVIHIIKVGTRHAIV